MHLLPCRLAQRLAAVLSLAAITACPIPSLQAATAAEEKLHVELRQLKTAYEKAVDTGDFTPLQSLFGPDTTGVVVDNRAFKTFAELKAIDEKFRADFPGVVYRVTLKPELSQLYGDIAVAHGTADEYVKTSAGEFTYTSSFTAVLRRTEAGWKLIRSQVTMDPFRNSIVQHFLSRTKTYFGLGGLAIGAIVGFLIGRAAGRRNLTPRNSPTSA
jgi:ketosteroid isomerase-like protein